MGLSVPVREAVPRAIGLIESLLESFVLTTNAGLVPA
jgi:hypothetical protein